MAEKPKEDGVDMARRAAVWGAPGLWPRGNHLGGILGGGRAGLATGGSGDHLPRLFDIW